MMLITMCDLTPFDDLATISVAVASLGPSIHFHNSFWILSTDKSLSHVHNTLRARIGLRPDLSVTELTHKHTEYLPNEAIDWLAIYRPRET